MLNRLESICAHVTHVLCFHRPNQSMLFVHDDADVHEEEHVAYFDIFIGGVIGGMCAHNSSLES